MKQTAQATTNHIISSLDQNLWDAISVKAINKMAPPQITNESIQIFNDFTKLTSVQQKTSGTNINDIHEPLRTSKLIERTPRSHSQKTSQKSQIPFFDHMRATRHRLLKTAMHEDNHHPLGKQKKKVNNFFKLTLQETHNEEEQKIDQAYRNSKVYDEDYSKKIEETKKELQQMRERRTATETKRFKEMKVFTYDFEGKLMSRGQQKPEGIHKVINMQPEFTEEQKITKVVQSRKTSKGSQITDKHVIYSEKPSLMELAKEKKRQAELEAEKKQRRNSFMKNVSLNKFQNIFTKNTRMAIGVSITDTDNRSRVAGEERDKSERKNLKLSEYRDQAKMTEYFPTRKNLKIMTNTASYKTEGDEPITRDRMRIKTQGNELSSKMTTSFRKIRPGRGIIHINHQKLYRQNFSPSPLDE